MKPVLTLADYQKAALTIGCQVAAIMAVALVESSGNGFDSSGGIKKRFEPHWFKRLSGKTATTFQQAFALDPTNAMKATSWGKFQIMGFNFENLGYSSVNYMVATFEKGEPEQLDGFIRFVQWKKLEDELKTLNWNGFAYIYNGQDYAKLGYHTKMANAYARYAADPTVQEAEVVVKKNG